MRLRPVEDDLEAEYWGRQIRLGGGIAVGVTLLGGLRVLADWAPGQRWWAAPILAAALVQALLLLLPWARLVRRPNVRELLIAWWVAEAPLLYAFAAADPAGAVLYLPGAILIVTTAAALYPPAWIVALGALSLAGFLALPGQVSSTFTLLVGLSAILVTIVGLNAGTAALRRRQAARRRTVERRTELLLETASDAVLAIGIAGEVRYASPSTRTLLGHDPQWLTGERLAAMLHPDDLPQAREWLAALTAGPARHTARLEVRMRRADGDWIYVDVIGANQTADPDLRAAVLSIRDIGARRALEEELARQAFSDSLTGLANRALFRDRVAHAVARNQRGNGRVSLLLIDLDDFKTVNDTWGHSAGDRLLTTVAERLRQQVRPSDTLARLGGDEFAVLVEDIDDMAVVDMAERILQAVRRPVPIGSREAVCTMSIGIATVKSTDDETDTEELMRDADLAMYAAKRAGRDRYVTFDPAMYTDVIREAEQRADLEQALVEGQFLVHYQPIVDLPTRRLTGVEALVRWQHPRDGLVGPDRFIPQAEETGLIVPLGRWVLRQACAQLADWQRERPSARSLRLSVNISARQFQYAGLVDDVAGVLTATGVEPSSLVLEITESMLMRDTDATIATLHALRDLGVSLAIDDFGTGYSSLSYLKQFPVDILKIDRAFVAGVHSDPDDATLAEAVVGLGRALRLQTVAEGIETTDQWATLRTLGCDLGQGFLFARPVDATEIEQLLDGDGTSLRE